MVVGDLVEQLDTVVVGSGPGGYVAAIRAAQLGKKVSIIEKGDIGGVCLNVGCIPSKALINVGHLYANSQNSDIFGISSKDVKIDFKKTQEWKDNEVVSKLTKGIEMLLKKNKVEIIRGEAYFNDTHQLRVITDDSAQSYSFNEAIIATGSRPIELPNFKFSKRVIDSTGALNLPEIPKSLVVIGGGYIGSEIASIYANLGSKVTILQSGDSILKGFDKDMVALVNANFKSRNVDIITQVRAQSATQSDDSVKVVYTKDKKELSIEADYVLVSAGRVPNTNELGLEMAQVELDDKGFVKVDKQGRTSQSHIFAIGDITPGPALAHKASYEAKVAAAALANKNSELDYVAMPEVCFTDPELASVGLTESLAKEQGLNVKAVKFPLQGNGRALSINQTEGFIRLISDKETGLLLGGQVVGANAGEIIAQIGLAVESRMNVEDIALTIFAHPTLNEAVMDAAELALGLPIHI